MKTTKLYCITDGKIFLAKGMKDKKTPYFWGSKRNFHLAVINGCLTYHVKNKKIYNWVYEYSDFVVCEYVYNNKTKEIQLVKQTPLLDYVENVRRKYLKREENDK